ncbi:MAG: NCS2 family permease [Gemmatimonadales bacterium]
MLDRRFGLRQARTSVKTELLAGATTFATLSYIIFVQPAVLAGAGMDFGAVMAATCVASAFATVLMGLLANYPIAVAPAMGHNFYFVYAVTQLGVPWQVALGADFLAGVLFLLLAGFRFREAVIDAIPDPLKAAIPVGIGLLIAFVGMQWGGIVVDNPGSLVRLGRLTSPAALLALGGFAVIAVLHLRRVPGAILIGIVATTVTGVLLGLFRYQGIVGRPPSLEPTLLELDVVGALRAEYIEIVLVFLFLALFDTVGTLIGVGSQAGFLRDGKLPRAGRALLADAAGTTAGTLLGTLDRDGVHRERGRGRGWRAHRTRESCDGRPAARVAALLPLGEADGRRGRGSRWHHALPRDRRRADHDRISDAAERRPGALGRSERRHSCLPHHHHDAPRAEHRRRPCIRLHQLCRAQGAVGPGTGGKLAGVSPRSTLSASLRADVGPFHDHCESPGARHLSGAGGCRRDRGAR